MTRPPSPSRDLTTATGPPSGLSPTTFPKRARRVAQRGQNQAAGKVNCHRGGGFGDGSLRSVDPWGSKPDSAQKTKPVLQTAWTVARISK